MTTPRNVRAASFSHHWVEALDENAQPTGTRLAELNVIVLKPKLIHLHLHKVYDSRTHKWDDFTIPTEAAAEAALNKYGRQCGLTFDVTHISNGAAGALDIAFDDDMDEAVNDDELGTILDEIPLLVDVGDQQPDPWIYHVFLHKGTKLESSSLAMSDGTPYRVRGFPEEDYLLLFESNWSDEETVLAIFHEMGHNFEDFIGPEIPFYKWDNFPESEWPEDVFKEHLEGGGYMCRETLPNLTICLLDHIPGFIIMIWKRERRMCYGPGWKRGVVIDAVEEWIRHQDWTNYNAGAHKFEQ